LSSARKAGSGEETEELRERIKRLIAAGHRRILLDLQEVSYIDSSGLSTLITSFVSVRKQGATSNSSGSPAESADVMQITKLSTVFEIYDTLEQAQNSFTNPPRLSERTRYAGPFRLAKAKNLGSSFDFRLCYW